MEFEKNIAPIVVFAFVRKDTLKQVIERLRVNYLAKDSLLYIYIDGPRDEKDVPLIKDVTDYCNEIKGFKSVYIQKSHTNIGLDTSVIKGVTEVLEKHGKAIVVEDDVITAPNFLDYMNFCLDKFEDDHRIMSISGWGIDLNIPADYKYDAYLFGRSTSWGWATWIDRWVTIDWEIKDWEQFRKNRKDKKSFKAVGGNDTYGMLKKCMNGGNMWDIRFCYNMFRKKMYSVIPVVSKCDNIGFNEHAIHCKPVKFKRYSISLDNGEKISFNIPRHIEPDMRIIRQRLKISSFKVRLITKIRNIIGL